jgi:hypothetical protein
VVVQGNICGEEWSGSKDFGERFALTEHEVLLQDRGDNEFAYRSPGPSARLVVHLDDGLQNTVASGVRSVP